jgi:hypothetical protein
MINFCCDFTPSFPKTQYRWFRPVPFVSHSC